MRTDLRHPRNSTDHLWTVIVLHSEYPSADAIEEQHFVEVLVE